MPPKKRSVYDLFGTKQEDLFFYAIQLCGALQCFAKNWQKITLWKVMQVPGSNSTLFGIVVHFWAVFGFC